MSTHLLPDATAPAAGDLTSVTVDGRVIAVANVAGQLYAFDDVCTHAQCSLSEGELEGGNVVCPCHAGTFDVRTGAVVSGPPKVPVGSYPARLVDGVLELDLRPQVPATPSAE